MDNNTEETTAAAETQTSAPEPKQEKPALDIRGSLEKNFSASDEAKAVRDTTKVEPSQAKVEREITQEKEAPIAVAPPADMNKAEREAFLNPTAQNAHILQQYLSRRAHETRSDYQRKTAEVEEMRRKAASVLDTVSKYEPEYAKQGINVADITRRSIEWDQAMRQNPVETARQWLETYGVKLEDLTAQISAAQEDEPTPSYLTREEAERIAAEKAEQQLQRYLEEQRNNQIANENLRTVQSFMSSKPLFRDQGTAAQLEEKMAPIVAALAQNGGSTTEVLETAYNYVVNGDPTFAALARKLEAAAEIPTKTTSAQKAKQASRSISGSVGSGTPRVQTKDIRENLRRRLAGL